MIIIFDIIEKIGHSVIHHGKANNRIYLMEYDEREKNQIIIKLEKLADDNGYDKIILKLPESACKKFQDKGYIYEAQIINYYKGSETCFFLSKFLSKERSKTELLAEYENIIITAKGKKETTLRPLNNNYSLVMLDETKVNEISDLYKEVFDSYPFPIFDPKYIASTMEKNIIYFGIYYREVLVALSSSEINSNYENAEMTDFAINPSHRGNQLAKHLLIKMEQEMIDIGLKTLYTIARSESLPMNCTFSGLRYKFGGTLINNTQISGKIESMNIWYKNLN